MSSIDQRVADQQTKVAKIVAKYDLLVRMTDEFIVPCEELGLYEKLRQFLLDQSQLNALELDTVKADSKTLLKQLANPYA